MASEMPTADAEQPKSLLAQYHERLIWRLTAWGGVAAFSLAAAVIVSQTASGHKRLRTALFGSEQPYQVPSSVASTTVPMPPADLIAVKRTTEAVKRATERTAARLETVERNTADTRAETKRLALQLSKLRADSFRVTGRLASIETQIGSITGSIRKHAEEAAAAAVAKAMPPKPAFETKAFDLTAPLISPPATPFPKLSLIVPQGLASTTSPLTGGAPRIANETESRHETGSGEARPDVTITSSITPPDTKSKDQSRVTSGRQGRAEPEAGSMVKASSRPEGLKTGATVETKAAPDTKQRITLKPEADGKPQTGHEETDKTVQSSPAATTVTGSIPARRRVSSRHWIPTSGYGVDLGGAESVTVAKAQWAAVKANFGPVLGGMRPLVVRNHRLLTAGEYRLVAGRTRSLASAEKLCKRLALQQMNCQPVEFENGRMIWR